MLWNIYFPCPIRLWRARHRNQLVNIRLEEGLVRQVTGEEGVPQSMGI